MWRRKWWIYRNSFEEGHNKRRNAKVIGTKISGQFNKNVGY